MRVLLDEMLPAGVAAFLPDHEVITVKTAGYSGLLNGELISAAVAAGFQVLVTADGSMPAQQNIAVSGIALVLVPGNRPAEIEPYAQPMRDAIATTVPGAVMRFGPLSTDQADGRRIKGGTRGA